MSLTTFSTGLSGLYTASEALNVVGNNLANLNTAGYKSSNISFSDVLGEQFSTPGTAASGNTASIGLGAQVSSVRANFNQGSLQTTNNPLDVAIQGSGFLVVNNAQGQFYTRAGNLQLDANGNLVNQGGANVQGYLQNPTTGQIDTTALQSIKIPSGLNNPVATSDFNAGMNLDASAAKGTEFTTSIQLYDTLGKPHTATVTLAKDVSGGATPTALWRFDITIPNNEVAGVAATDTKQYSLITGKVATTPPAAGALAFDGTGKLTSAYLGADPTTLPALANITLPPTGGTLPQLTDGGSFSASGITWTLLDPTNGTPNITGFGSASEVSASSQNGAAAGSLNSLSIQSDGTISAVFSNGTTTNVGQIALARFSNVGGLVDQGSGLYGSSVCSGTAFIGAAGQGGRGTLNGGSLEQSNVDLATELTKIITFQRGYQASAKIITATDQIMQDTINMKQ
jgi:flagellar hook protein FlgE